MKKEDRIYEWKGFGDGFGKWDSKCRIRIYENDDAQIVVATELSDNTGTSITNCCEIIAGKILADFGLDFRKFVWIEHNVSQDIDRGIYEKKSQADFETFDLLGFEIEARPNPLTPNIPKARFVKPQWKRIKKEHVESLIGEAL